MKIILWFFLLIFSAQSFMSPVFAKTKRDKRDSNSIIHYYYKTCNNTGKALSSVITTAYSNPNSYENQIDVLQDGQCTNTTSAYAVSGIIDWYRVQLVSDNVTKGMHVVYVFGWKKCNVYAQDPPIEIYIFAKDYGRTGIPYMIEIRQVGSDSHCYAYQS